MSGFFLVALLAVAGVWAYQSRDKVFDPLGIRGSMRRAHSSATSQATWQFQGTQLPDFKPAFDASQLKMYDWSKFEQPGGIRPFQPSYQSSSRNNGFGTRR